MIDSKTICLVTNRSASMVGYVIPEDNIRRTFEPGETKRIPHGELEKLSYQSGGIRLINDYLLIANEESRQDLNVVVEPEYFLDQNGVIQLIKEGSLDAWLDCLDFAPAGVIEMVKRLSVDVPLNDYEKRKALKQKTGFDVDAAIRHVEEERAEEGTTTAPSVKERRTKTGDTSAVAEGPVRRTAPKYKVVSQ